MCLKNTMNLSTVFLYKYFVIYWLLLQVSGNTTISERYQRSFFVFAARLLCVQQM